MLTRFRSEERKESCVSANCWNSLQKMESEGEVGPGQKQHLKMVHYYYINYKQFVNVVKFKLDHMRKKIESEEKQVCICNVAPMPCHSIPSSSTMSAFLLPGIAIVSIRRISTLNDQVLCLCVGAEQNVLRVPEVQLPIL